MYLLLPFIFLLSLLSAQEPLPPPSSLLEIAERTQVSEFLIGGVVSPISGQPLLSKTDLIAAGALPIAFERIYNSPLVPASFASNPKEDYLLTS